MPTSTTPEQRVRATLRYLQMKIWVAAREAERALEESNANRAPRN